MLIAGALIRYFYNKRHAGNGDKWWAWAVSAAAIAGAIALSASRFARRARPVAVGAAAGKGLAANAPQAQPEIVEIIQSKCSMCHAEFPSWPGIGIAPKGVLLDTAEAIEHNRREIARLSTFSHAMPPNNITELTADERKTLTAWIAGKSWPE